MIEKQATARTCFVCGKENDKGLHLVFYSDREKRVVFSSFVIPAEYCGYPGIAHGGIVSAVMDEISGRAFMIDDNEHQILFLTAGLEVKFKLPTPANRPLRIEGWVTETDGRKAVVHAEIRTEDGTVTASSIAHMVKAPDKFTDIWALAAGGEYWRVEPDD